MNGVAIAKKQKGLKRDPFFAKLAKAKTREEKHRLVRKRLEEIRMSLDSKTKSPPYEAES